MRPYIGICDFTAPEQAHRLLQLIPHGFSHDLMVGVMMSYKTLNNLPTKWARVFPAKKNIRSIFVDDPRVLNTIHYADYATGVDADRQLAYTLAKVEIYGGACLGAIQLDMIWPDPDELKKFREHCNIPIILQVGANAMRECGDDPIATCERLKTYGTTINAVLFDKSMGRGVGMDAALLAKYAGVLSFDCPHLAPAVAGGVGPSSMDLVAPPIRAFPDLSIDAQGRLRKSGNMKDPIDWSMAEDYFTQAVALFSKQP